MIFSRRITFRDRRDQILYILGVVDDVTERKLAEARIARLAHYDPLTEVPNRTLFREQLMRELSFVRRGAKLAVSLTVSAPNRRAVICPRKDLSPAGDTR